MEATKNLVEENPKTSEKILALELNCGNLSFYFPCTNPCLFNWLARLVSQLGLSSILFITFSPHDSIVPSCCNISVLGLVKHYTLLAYLRFFSNYCLVLYVDRGVAKRLINFAICQCGSLPSGLANGVCVGVYDVPRPCLVHLQRRWLPSVRFANRSMTQVVIPKRVRRCIIAKTQANDWVVLIPHPCVNGCVRPVCWNVFCCRMFLGMVVNSWLDGGAYVDVGDLCGCSY